jgi:hypothetical protein
MASKKGKEKCKDEKERPEFGAKQYGTTLLEGSQSKNPDSRKGGQKWSPTGAKKRDNPPEQWGPRLTKAGNPSPRRRNPGKNGPGRGGDKAYRVAVKDAVSDSDGLRDALHEQAEETRVAQDANMHLRRDLLDVQEDLKQADTELGRRRNYVDQIHSETRRNFRCEWQDETPISYALFILMVLLVPVLIVCAAVHLEMLEILFQWQVLLTLGIYQVAAVFIDRSICSKRGCRSLFSARATHSYSTVDMQDWDTDDRRADTMSLREMKHSDAKYGVVAYSHTLNGSNVRRDMFGRLAKAAHMLISFELLSQLTTPLVMLARDQETAWERMETSAKSTHTVNIDKDLFVASRDVVGNTLQVAHGLWLQNHQARLGHFRPALA